MGTKKSKDINYPLYISRSLDNDGNYQFSVIYRGGAMCKTFPHLTDVLPIAEKINKETKHAVYLWDGNMGTFAKEPIFKSLK